jgi:hypothetical protein
MVNPVHCVQVSLHLWLLGKDFPMAYTKFYQPIHAYLIMAVFLTAYYVLLVFAPQSDNFIPTNRKNIIPVKKNSKIPMVISSDENSNLSNLPILQNAFSIMNNLSIFFHYY